MIRITFSIVTICLWAGVVHAATDENTDFLWRAYAQGSGQKQELLRDAYKNLLNLKAAAEQGQPASQWATSPNARWLMSYRTPAMLVVKRELERDAAGRYLEVLVHLAEMLGHRALTRKLPDLLSRAVTVGARGRILEALARMRGRESREALRKFLKNADETTPASHICTAARGLSQSGREEYLPLLRRMSELVETKETRLCLAAARYSCGEERMLEGLRDVLRQGDASERIMRSVLDFIEKKRPPNSVGLVASYALQAKEDELADRAVEVLRSMTGFRQLPGETAPEITEFRRPSDDPEAFEPEEERHADGASRRRAQVRKILTWWEQHGKNSQETKTEAGRTGGLPH
jgi:hypothetical protein